MGTAMDMEQELEWKKAQNTAVNVDLVAAAKRQLKFLAAVDRNRWLYSEGPALNMAIYRYKVYWLPLLAKHSESSLFEGPLVVPLDCEWVWHCHRLNPVRYKSDCEELYGIILDNHNVVSTVEGASKTKTEEIWKNLYPDMPYELNLTKVISNAAVSDDVSGGEKYTKYDLLTAVKRQSSFFYQVARQHMSNELYLEGAVARYKAFLHLIKINRERSIKSFSVPTYDVDLMWHTHQLHPTSYCKDLVEIMGKVLEHDDTDSDRTKGKKLDVGFSGTTKQWEEIYGVRYWRAGAMHRGNAPLPLRTTPYLSLDLTKKDSLFKENQKIAPLSEVKVVEVMLEFVDVKNQPEEHKGSLFVSFRKTQPDTIFNAKRNLTILSQSGEKQVACFQCQPTGHLLFELMCNSASNFPISKPVKTMGSGSVSLEDLLSPLSKLTMEKWLEFVPSSKSGSSKPFYLRVALSITVPTNGPRVLHLIRSRPYSKNSCFFPLPGRVHLAKSWTRVIDDNGNEIISLQMRESKKPNERNDPMVRKEVIGITKSGGTNRFAEFTGREWLLIDSNWSVKIPGTVNEYGHLVEMIGDRSVKFFPGRKLEYEPKHCRKQRNDHDFLTAVEFSAEDPYGKALALFDFKTGTIKINEEWLLFPGLILAFILGEMLRKEGYISINSSDKNLEESECLDKEVSHCQMEDSKTLPTTEQESRKLDRKVSAITMVEGRKCNGGCGGGCGSACGNEVNSGACGGCGANCVNVLKSGSCGGCGGGCGSGCGNMVKSGGCGGCGGCGAGCGGGCGNMIKSGGCGGCGGGCGGGGCGGGCGNKIRGEGSMDAGACGGCGGSGGCGGNSGNQLVDTCKASKDCITEQKEILVA